MLFRECEGRRGQQGVRGRKALIPAHSQGVCAQSMAQRNMALVSRTTLQYKPLPTCLSGACL